MDQAAGHSAMHAIEPAHEARAGASARRRRGGVAVICTDQVLARELGRALERCDIESAVFADAGTAATAALDGDAVLIDLAGAGAIRQLKRLGTAARPPLVAIVGAACTAAAQEHALACGAYLLARPISHGVLAAVLQRAIGEQRHRELLAYHLQRELHNAGLAHVIGESAPMLRLKTRLRLLLDRQWHASAEAPRFIMLHGERGTGKARLAKALHHDGPRRAEAWVHLDARGMAPGEIEGRLFGAERSARQGGLLGLAAAGTLYIREIADIPVHLQARLAQRIEDGAPARATGAGWALADDVLLIVGSRSSPDRLAAQGRLWRLLAGRFSASEFQLAPLRERDDDVCLLARGFMRELAEHHGLPPPSWTRGVRPALLRHPWSGNVRELRHVMAHALLARRNSVIGGADLPLDPGHPTDAQTADANLELSRIESDALSRALERAKGNVSKSARLLGISRDTLRYRMVKQGLSRDDFRRLRGGLHERC